MSNNHLSVATCVSTRFWYLVDTTIGSMICCTIRLNDGYVIYLTLHVDDGPIADKSNSHIVELQNILKND